MRENWPVQGNISLPTLPIIIPLDDEISRSPNRKYHEARVRGEFLSLPN